MNNVIINVVLHVLNDQNIQNRFFLFRKCFCNVDVLLSYNNKKNLVIKKLSNWLKLKVLKHKTVSKTYGCDIA